MGHRPQPGLEALQADLPVRRAYLAEGVERDSRLSDILKLAAEQGVPLLQASRSELDRLTGGAVHQGVALQLPEYEYAHPSDLLADALDTDAPLVVACDSITDPRNLGAIIRSAAAFGAQGVIVPERRSAHMTATAWKASAGAAARIPVALAATSTGCWPSTRRRGSSSSGWQARAIPTSAASRAWTVRCCW